MTIKEDIQRAIDISKSEEFEAITSMPSYQAELERTKNDYKERSWIDVQGFLPKFTTEEFEQKRITYQAKYGNTVNVPGFTDVIHVLPRAKISTEEMAAHRFAQKRGLPSPLSNDQLAVLTYKKGRFVRMLASTTPTWLKTYGAVATSADNIEDAMVTLYWAGRLALSVAPRLLERATPVLGWLLLGSDILNFGNLVSQVGALRRGCKGLHGTLRDRNPFSAKAGAERATRLKQKTPGFGAFLEFLQTTDQLFGVGLCLGGLMGMVQEASLKAMDPDYWRQLGGVIESGNINEIADFASKAAMNDYNSIKKGLQQQYKQLEDEAYRLKTTDIKLRADIEAFIKQKGDEAWNWIKTRPEEASKYYNDSLIGSLILSTGMQDFLKDQHTKAFMFLNHAMNGVMPWWYENDPVKNMKEIMNWKWRAPEPKDPATISILEEGIHDWKSTIKWPHIEQKYATFEEIGYNYAPKIKESFQTYCLNYQHDYTAMAAAYECTDFVKNVVRSFDDDHQVRVGYDAYTAAAIDMIDQGHFIDPSTSQILIDQLYEYIGQHERTTGNPPKIKDVVNKGSEIGIKWLTEPPKEISPKAKEIFPGWSAIQDQIEKLHISD